MSSNVRYNFPLKLSKKAAPRLTVLPIAGVNTPAVVDGIVNVPPIIPKVFSPLAYSILLPSLLIAITAYAVPL